MNQVNQAKVDNIKINKSGQKKNVSIFLDTKVFFNRISAIMIKFFLTLFKNLSDIGSNAWEFVANKNVPLSHIDLHLNYLMGRTHCAMCACDKILVLIMSCVWVGLTGTNYCFNWEVSTGGFCTMSPIQNAFLTSSILCQICRLAA